MADAGKTLASAPVSEIIKSMAMSIADAQTALDAASRKTAVALAQEKFTFTNADGEDVERSLLALGFTPSFYSFVAVDLELRLETRITESSDVGGEVTVNANTEQTGTAGGAAGAAGGDPAAEPAAEPPTRTTSMGMTMSANFQRKFGVETSGHTQVTAQLVALPPPAAFMDFISGLSENGN